MGPPLRPPRPGQNPGKKKEKRKIPIIKRISSEGWTRDQFIKYWEDFTKYDAEMQDWGSYSEFRDYNKYGDGFHMLPYLEHEYARRIYNDNSQPTGNLWQDFLQDLGEDESNFLIEELNHYGIDATEHQNVKLRKPKPLPKPGTFIGTSKKARTDKGLEKKHAKLPPLPGKPKPFDFKDDFDDQDGAGPSEIREPESQIEPSPDIFSGSELSDSPVPSPRRDFPEQQGPVKKTKTDEQPPVLPSPEQGSHSSISGGPPDIGAMPRNSQQSMDVDPPAGSSGSGDSGIAGTPARAGGMGQGSGSGGHQGAHDDLANGLITPHGKYSITGQKWSNDITIKVKTFPYVSQLMNINSIGDANQQFVKDLKAYLQGMSIPTSRQAGAEFNLNSLYTTHLANFPTNSMGIFISRVMYQNLLDYAWIDKVKISVSPWSKRTPFNTNSTATGTANSQMDTYASYYIGKGITQPTLECRYAVDTQKPCIPVSLQMRLFPDDDKFWDTFMWGWVDTTNADRVKDLPVCMGIPRHLPLYEVLWVQGEGPNSDRETTTALAMNEFIPWYQYVTEFDFDQYKGQVVCEYEHTYKNALIKYITTDLTRLRSEMEWGETGDHVVNIQGCNNNEFRSIATPNTAQGVGMATCAQVNSSINLSNSLCGRNLGQYDAVKHLPLEKCSMIANINELFDSKDAPPKLLFGVRPIQSNVSNIDAVEWAALDIEWKLDIHVEGHTYKKIPGINYAHPHNLIKLSFKTSILSVNSFGYYGAVYMNGQLRKLKQLGTQANIVVQQITDSTNEYFRNEQADYTVNATNAIPATYAQNFADIEEPENMLATKKRKVVTFDE